MSKVIISPAAGEDALQIWEYIARDNSRAADQTLDQFNNLFSNLQSNPLLGKGVTELGDDLRVFYVGRYDIFYRVSSDGIEIVRMLHSSREITAELFGYATI
jgi:toxin ParE1/3/4